MGIIVAESIIGVFQFNSRLFKVTVENGWAGNVILEGSAAAIYSVISE